MCVGTAVAQESLGREGSRVAACWRGRKTTLMGAQRGPRISTVPLGSEDKPTSLKRQGSSPSKNTHSSATSEQQPSVKTAPASGMLIKYYNRWTHTPLQQA